jgi:hypothetical protein
VDLGRDHFLPGPALAEQQHRQRPLRYQHHLAASCGASPLVDNRLRGTRPHGVDEPEPRRLEQGRRRIPRRRARDAAASSPARHAPTCLASGPRCRSSWQRSVDSRALDATGARVRKRPRGRIARCRRCPERGTRSSGSRRATHHRADGHAIPRRLDMVRAHGQTGSNVLHPPSEVTRAATLVFSRNCGRRDSSV